MSAIAYSSRCIIRATLNFFFFFYRFDFSTIPARTDLDRGNQESNRLSKEVGRLKKAGEDTTEAQKAAKEQEAKVRELERRHEEAEREAGKSLAKIGNLVHDDVPVSADEADNEVVRRHGQGRPQKGLYNHVDLVRMLGMVELEKGAEVAGSRGYFLRGYGTLLNHALISYAMAFLARYDAHFSFVLFFFLLLFCFVGDMRAHFEDGPC